MERGNGRMVQRSKDASLPLESGQTLGVLGKGFGENFDRDLAAELGVPGAVHFSHAAAADFLQDRIVRESFSSHGDAAAYWRRR